MPQLTLKPLPTDRSFKALFAANTRYAYFEHAKDQPFQFAAETFLSVNAWWLAEAAMLAYVQDANFVREALRAAGLTQVCFFDRNEAQCFVVYNADFILVCFRGTEVKMEDLFTDLQFHLVDAEQGAQVHAGFQRALNALWPEVKGYLMDLGKNNGAERKLWFTGHSLGAALAILAANRLRDAQGVYAFGCPRVGDLGFAEACRVKTYRVVNNNDLVTRMPPETLGYRHVGTLAFIDRCGRLHCMPQHGHRKQDRHPGTPAQWNEALGQWNSDVFDAISRDGLSDHAPIDYVVKTWNHAVREARVRQGGEKG